MNADVGAAARRSEFEDRSSEPSGLSEREVLVLLVGQLGIGGAERHMITLANLLGARYDIVLAYLKPDDQLVDQVQKTSSLKDLHCLKVSRRLDWRAARELAALAARHEARLIVCANAFPLLYAHLARWVSRTPFSIAEVFHTTKPRSLKEWLSLAFYRPFFWAADHVVFVCEAQRRYWARRALFGRRSHMIHNGVDLEHFYADVQSEVAVATRQAFGFTPDDRVVGICAALRPEKAHSDLLAAVARLREEGQRWRVLIIGDGPMRSVIERDIERLALGDDVRITGLQSDVRGSLAACDVVALVSTSETFSIASLEAMAMARPMIMSDVGGAREQVADGVNGYVYPAGDVKALAGCLRQCWGRGTAGALGREARRRMEREFSMQAMLDAYVSLIDRILANRVRPAPSHRPRVSR